MRVRSEERPDRFPRVPHRVDSRPAKLGTLDLPLRRGLQGSRRGGLRGVLAMLLCQASIACAEPSHNAPRPTRTPARSEASQALVPAQGAPRGPDQRELQRLEESTPEGLAPIPGVALGGAAFQGGQLVLREEGTLEMRREGAVHVIDREVVLAPVVDAGGHHAAWVARRPLEEQALIVVDREGGRFEVARGLVSIGALSFDATGQRIAFVGASNGGIAGLWWAHTASDGNARCATNCLLRTGMDEPMVPLPRALQHVERDAPLRFEGDALVWESEQGTHRVMLTEAP